MFKWISIINVIIFKKSWQSLKLDTAITLQAVIKSCGNKLDIKLLISLIEQCSEFVNDNDLHLCQLILDLLSSILVVNPLKCGKTISNAIFPCCFKFLDSPLLQRHALDSLKKLFSIFEEELR